MGIQEVSVFRGIQEVSARRVRKELINHNLYLFAWSLKVDYGWPFVNNAEIKKYIYSHSTRYICTQGIILHPVTVYLCSFKELYLFNFKEMIYLLTVKEINSYKEQRTLTYSFTELYSFQGTYQFIQGIISSFNENIFYSGKLYLFKETYSFKERIFVQVQGHMFIQGTVFIEHCCVRGQGRNIYSKLVPSHFMIIASFTISISWIKYSYNSFQMKDEKIVDMIEGSVL